MTKITRRTLLKASSGAGLSLLLSQGLPRPAISQSAASIVVSTWGGDTENSIRKFVQPKFEALTKATIVYDIGGQGARYNKLLSQRNNPPADVFLSSDEAVVAALGQDIITTVSKTNIPNAADIKPQAQTVGDTGDGNLPGVPFSIVSYVLGYSPKSLQQPLIGWEDLWRPEVADRLAFASTVHTQMPALVIVAAELAGGSVDNVDPGFKKLAELRPSKLTVFWTDWAALYQSGDVTAATEFDYYLEGMKAQGFDINYVVPKEKGIGTPVYTSVVKGTKNTELAEVFLNLMLDPEVQENFAKTTFQGPANSKVVLPDDIAAKVAYGARLEQLRFMDPAVLVKNRPVWTERMNTEVVPNWRVR